MIFEKTMARMRRKKSGLRTVQRKPRMEFL